MPYQIVLSSQATSDLSRWPLPLQNYLEQQLLRLAADPTGLSQPGTFPYPADCQLFQPDPVVLDDQRHELTILFRYDQDEITIHVIAIGHLAR